MVLVQIVATQNCYVQLLVLVLSQLEQGSAFRLNLVTPLKCARFSMSSIYSNIVISHVRSHYVNPALSRPSTGSRAFKDQFRVSVTFTYSDSLRLM